MPKLIPSKRARNTIYSPIRKFAPLAEAAEKRGIEIHRLSSGDPDIHVPALFFKTLQKYRGPHLKYAPSSGMPDHVDAWVEYYKNIGVRVEPRNIIPTVGCAEAILFAMQAVADPGDELIVFEPLYVSYRSFATMLGIKLVPILLEFTKSFALPPLAQLEKKLTPRTKGIVVINPDNPTGKLWHPRELAEVAAFAKKHDLFIISDETYREIRFSGRPYSMLKKLSTKENVIVVDSVSKRFSLPGARLGCVVSYNDAIMQATLKFAQARLSVGTLEQFATSPLLRDARRITKSLVKEYERRCKIAYQELSKIPGVHCHRPQGAFYMCAKLPIRSAEEFVKFMVQDFSYKGKTVLISPMKDFYVTQGVGEDEIRIACVLPPKELKLCMHLLDLGLQAYLKSGSDRAKGSS